MNQGNHILSGAILTECYLAYTGYLWNPQALFSRNGILLSVPAATFICFGSIFPDTDVRLNIPNFHRTIFHWPILYICLLSLGALAFPIGSNMFSLVLGFSIACIVHIAMDYNTPTGVPLGLNPFGHKHSSNLVRVNSPDEILVTITILSLAIIIYWAPLILHKLFE